MDFSQVTCAAFLLMLFTAACGAPTGSSLQDACLNVRTSSLEFNQIAKSISLKAQSGSRHFGEIDHSLVWMEAKDMCDPESLKDKSMPCIGKMLSALKSYSSAVERVSGFQSCSEFASQVKPALHKLHKDMSNCINSVSGWKQEMETNISEEESKEPIPQWEEAPVCLYIMDRLFSFSILTARVFALGDPALHSGSTPKCM